MCGGHQERPKHSCAKTNCCSWVKKHCSRVIFALVLCAAAAVYLLIVYGYCDLVGDTVTKIGGTFGGASHQSQ